jgi:5'-nucleotidase (lipoprotein e(P4) family)
MSRLAPITVFALLLVSACSTSTPRPDSTRAPTTTATQAATAALPLPDDNLNAVAWTQTAVERDLIYRQAYRAATLELPQALSDPTWEALAKGERKSPMVDPGKTAVILDIDETTLDNSPYQARLVVNGEHYDEFTWHQWCLEEKAAAVPGALEFARFAASKGVTVFYLSNRASDLSEATLDNLRKLGFPIASDDVFLGLGAIVQGCEQNGSDKGCRRELISRKYRVLLQVGDQLGDFVDVIANTPEGREQAVAPYLDWVGQRWFVLPNPTYGSWEPALFNNDWTQPATERRRAKEAALHLN